MIQSANPELVIACNPSERFIAFANSRQHDECLSFQAASLEHLPRIFECFEVFVSCLVREKSHLIYITTVFNPFSDYWDLFLAGTGPAPIYGASLKPEERNQLATNLKQCLTHTGDGKINRVHVSGLSVENLNEFQLTTRYHFKVNKGIRNNELVTGGISNLGTIFLYLFGQEFLVRMDRFAGHPISRRCWYN